MLSFPPADYHIICYPPFYSSLSANEGQKTMGKETNSLPEGQPTLGDSVTVEAQSVPEDSSPVQKSAAEPVVKTTVVDPEDKEASHGYDLYPERLGGKYRPSIWEHLFLHEGENLKDQINCEKNVYNCFKKSKLCDAGAYPILLKPFIGCNPLSLNLCTPWSEIFSLSKLLFPGPLFNQYHVCFPRRVCVHIQKSLAALYFEHILLRTIFSLQ